MSDDPVYGPPQGGREQGSPGRSHRPSESVWTLPRLLDTLFTGIIAASTLVYVVVSYCMLTKISGQLTEMHSQTQAAQTAANATRDAANAAKSAAETAAKQLAEMAKETPALLDQAAAAKSAADTAERSLIDVQRPVLIVSISDVSIPPIPQQLDLRDSGNKTFSATLRVENVGTQLAIIESARGRLWIAPGAQEIPDPDISSSITFPMGGWMGWGEFCIQKNDTEQIVRTSNPVDFPCASTVDVAKFRRYVEGDARIVLSLHLQYRDPLGITRVQGSTWIYNRNGATGSFVKQTDVDHDYDRRLEPHDTRSSP